MSFIRPSTRRLSDRLTMADVSDAVRGNPSLSKRKRQEMLSAINTVAKVLGRALADIPADPILLARRLSEAAPVACGISKGRWANVRSLVGLALSEVMPVLAGRQTHEIESAWQALDDQLTEAFGHAGSGRVKLSSVMHLFSAHGINPAEVDKTAFATYKDALVNSL